MISSATYRPRRRARRLRFRLTAVAPIAAALLVAGPAWAQDDAPKIDTGDTAWVLTAPRSC